MAEYTEITGEQYFDELGSRIEKLKKELENGPSSRIELQKLITSVGLETAKMLENMEEPELKPVYLKVNWVDPLFGSNSFEVMPKARYERVKNGREFYSRRQ